MKNLIRIEDLYKDKTTFYKSLAIGEGTASPYTDSSVVCNILIVIVNSEDQNCDRWRTQVHSQQL